MSPPERQRPDREDRGAGSRAASTSTKVLRAVVEADDDTIVIRAMNAFDVLRPAGFRPVFIGAGMGGWCMSRHRRGVDRLADVVAALEAARYRVRVMEANPGDAA